MTTQEDFTRVAAGFFEAHFDALSIFKNRADDLELHARSLPAALLGRPVTGRQDDGRAERSWSGLCVVAAAAVIAATACAGPSKWTPVGRAWRPQRSTEQRTTPASLRVAVLLAEFPDARHSVSAEQMKAKLFPALGDYYREDSYGAFSVTGDVVPDWLVLPKALAAYGEMKSDWPAAYDRVESVAADAVTAAGKALDPTASVAIVVVPKVPLRGMQGFVRRADGTTLPVIVMLEHYPAAVFAHELGHVLGLPDIYDEKSFAKGLPADIYVGPWCLMSLVRGFFHFSAFHKLRLGWLKPERVKTVSPAEDTLVRLKPLESTVQEGFQAVKVPLGDRLYYLVELRRPIGFDHDLPDEGMLVTLVHEKIPECMHHDDCFLRVVNAEPDKPDLRHATFDLRPGKQNAFVAPDRDLVIALVAREGAESVIRVATREQWRATAESANPAPAP